MTIPKQRDVQMPLLGITSDGKEHTLTEARKLLAPRFRLTKKDRVERLDCGEFRFNNYVRWGYFQLKKKGLVVALGTGRFRISKKGFAALKSVSDIMNASYSESRRLSRKTRDTDQGKALVDGEKAETRQDDVKNEHTDEESSLLARENNPEKRREIELRAMEYVMHIERKLGRICENVSSIESFDIISRDATSNHIYYVEVKGHSGNVTSAELTENEFQFAQTKGNAYVLYIVYNLDTSRPTHRRIENPTNSMMIKKVVTTLYILS